MAKTSKKKRVDPTFRGAEDATHLQARAGMEIGDSGTEILQGIIREDFNPKLSESRAMKVYDEMRRTDSTVRATLSAVSLPISSANWFVQPATDDAQDQEVADFVQSALMEWADDSFNDFMRHALLMLLFGVMAFEKVFTVREVEGKQMIVWKRIAPRLPKSIERWQTSDGGEGIEQRKVEGGIVSIPMDKLLVFVNEKEGDNWWGMSILRTAYQPWYIKQYMYKISAIAYERQGLGIPFAKLPQNASSRDIAKAEKLLREVRAHQHAYILEPHDMEFGFKDMQARNVMDPMPLINHHNREITKAMLAQFLELGAEGGSGSRALSEDHSELFLSAVDAVARNIADTFTKYAIKELVDLNFDDVQWYPKLTYTGVRKEDIESLAKAYKELTDAGGISPTENDEQFWRKKLNLPDKDIGDQDDDTDTTPPARAEDEDELIDELEMSDKRTAIKKKIFPERREIRGSVRTLLTSCGSYEKAIEKAKHLISAAEGVTTNKQFWSKVKAELTFALADLRRQSFQEDNDFTSWRQLTFAERKVDFKSIQERLDDIEEKFRVEATEILERGADRYVKQLSQAILNEDEKAIENATLPVRGAYRAMIKRYLRDIYTFGKNGAAREMGREAPATPDATRRQIDITADTIVKDHIHAIETRAKTALVQAIRKPEPIEASENKSRAIGAIGAAVAAVIGSKVRHTAAIVMAGFVNFGRNDVFERYEDDIYALQWSAVLDGATCNLCLSLDARVFEKRDPIAQSAPVHSGCRCIIVEILKDEQDPPAIEGVPQSVRNRVGDETNDILQPKDPIVKKDSSAQRELERRAKRRVKKQNEQ